MSTASPLSPPPEPSAAKSSSATPSLSTQSSSRVPFKDSIWRPITSCGGALAIGVLLSPFFIKPAAPPTGKTELPEIILPRETTMIVVPSMPPGALMRGQIRLVADVMGKAPVGGAVARQVVEPGTRVKKGDSVMEISTGESERPAPAAESLQNQAEQSQIAASNAQNALAQKISIAQSQLRAAQERVERSQNQVAAARDIVRRLQNGEAVSSQEIPAPFRGGTVRKERPAKKRAVKETVSPSSRVSEIALQQAQAAREAAAQGAADVKAARQMLTDARSAARDASDKLKVSAKSVSDVEERFDDKKATGADVEIARSAQRDAQVTATAADKAVTSATAEVARREKAAATMQSYADKTAADAKAALKSVQLFPGKNEASAEPTDVPEPSGTRPQLDQAIQFASAAIDESRRASREAEKIHSEIDDYQRQVTSSSARIESATQGLASAQQRVLDSVPRANFTPALAPSDGIVTWVSRLAREVQAGQSVFGIARGGKMGARFEDKSNLWRGVKPGAVLSAVAVSNPKSEAPAAPGTAVAPESRQLLQVRITEVEAPSGSDEAAVVSGEVSAAPVTSGTDAPVLAPPALGAGTVVMASVSRPGEKTVLSVPTSALVQRGSQYYVAVLAPATETRDKAQTPESGGFHLLWKNVQLGRGDGFRREIVAGIAAGNRIVSAPDHLQEMGFAPEPALPSQASGRALPQEVSSDEILVRLTPASA